MIKIFFIVILVSWLNFVAVANVAANDNNQNCVNCHQEQQHQWLKSDHAKSMALPTADSVVANFDNQVASHYGQQARFYIKNSQYLVDISYDDKVETLPIKFTFGHYPLQQFLVETKPGSLHVLPFAWDARDQDAGGQRWYHNYSNEEIKPADRLHWRQPLQNWNGMCADCHSDGLKRGYDSVTDQFNSQWTGINVGCVSCHGDLTPQHQKPVKKDTGFWQRLIGHDTASWQGKKRDNRFMDNCFSCHALRAPLVDGIKPNTPFMDQFMPRLLEAPVYYSDGQIKDEVYVFGSFSQSKMFAKGVNCIDCHDQHTMKLKIEGNGLCLQCHNQEKFDVKSHHQHSTDSAGAQCANCHMPTNRYMGVDDRRDHSFKIPRPDLSIKFGVPNACIKCHQQQNNQWAQAALKGWHGASKTISVNRENYYLLHNGHAISLAQHLAIIDDPQIDVITRATALRLLAYTGAQLSSAQLAGYLTDSEPLLRLAAAGTAALLPPAQRIKLVSPLLNDSLKAIRIVAAQTLIDAKLLGQDLALFKRAFNELVISNQQSSWRGEGRLNQGILAMRNNQPSAAEQSFKAAIKIDPYFEASYINLADFYRSQQQASQVRAVLVSGMAKLPQAPGLKYSYGLHLIRQQQRDKAVDVFEQAMKLAPLNPQYLYTYVLSLDGVGKTTLALEQLQLLIIKHSGNQSLKDLGLYLAQKEQNLASYQWFQSL